MPIPNNCAVCTTTWTVTGSTRPQTITCAITNSSAATAQDIDDVWYAHMFGQTYSIFKAGEMSNAYTLTQTSTTLNRLGLFTQAVTTRAGVGTVANSPPPPQVCVNVKKVTGLSNKKYRGRFFAPAGWVDEGNINVAGHLDSGTVTALQALATATFTHLAAAGMQPVLLHNDATPATTINAWTVQGNTATLRHRKPR